MSLPSVHVLGVPGIPEVSAGDDLVDLAVRAVRRAGIDVGPGDVLVVTQKIVSKAEGRLVRLDEVSPSAVARAWAEATGRDARAIELALGETARVVRMDRGVLIVETRHGLVCANGGVDTSNVPDGWAALLPSDPDASAKTLCEGFRAAFGCAVGVVVSDTFGRPWREGQTNVAIGVSGFHPIVDYRGVTDPYGHRLVSTAIAVADELAAAAETVMGKTRAVPIAIVKGAGVRLADCGAVSARPLLRRREDDLFR